MPPKDATIPPTMAIAMPEDPLTDAASGARWRRWSTCANVRLSDQPSHRQLIFVQPPHKANSPQPAHQEHKKRQTTSSRTVPSLHLRHRHQRKVVQRVQEHGDPVPFQDVRDVCSARRPPCLPT